MTNGGGEARSIYDPSFVKELFDRCSRRYIAFSFVCSFGFTERWRRQCVEALALPAQKEQSGIDLMSGTGEVWPHLLRRFPNVKAIVAVDISSGMHARAMSRLHRHRAHKIDFIEDDALESRLADDSADFLVATFGLKTFNAEQQRRLAALIARVLKPGGRFSLIEASDPKDWLLRPLYIFHLTLILPFIERVFLRGAQDFAMIGTYCLDFGDAAAFADQLRANGLQADFRRYFFGCATGVSGSKPPS